MSRFFASSVSARRRLAAAVVAGVAMGAGVASVSYATPYASNVVVTGTGVTFTLNENADSLYYSVNGGPVQALTPTRGAQGFSLTAPTDTFAIFAAKNDAVGYTIPTGGTIPGGGTTVATGSLGLGQDSPASGLNQTSDDNNNFVRFNSPRGIDVSTNPNAPNFGTAYIANSAAGPRAASGTAAVRNLGDGLYAVRADQSDALAQGDTAASPGGIWPAGGGANSPFRVQVSRGTDGDVWVTGFSDANSNIFRVGPSLTTGQEMFGGSTGNTALPAGQNHGSSTAVYTEGSVAGGNLKIWSLDEDLTDAQFGGPAGDNRNSLWRYDVLNNAAPFNTAPTRINQNAILVPAATSDLDRGANGKFYLAQFRSAGAESGIIVLNSDGSTAYTSLAASRTILNNPAASDIMRNSQAIALSPDGKFIAVLLNSSDVAIIPLDANGLPLIDQRLVVDSANPDINSGRDIAYDAAGNLHYVSSGQQLYRVLSPGGQTVSTYSSTGAPGGNAFGYGGDRTLYWDVNGTTAGPGGTTPAGNWDGGAFNFNTSSTGATGSGIYASTAAYDNVVFAATGGGTGAYTVNVTGTQNAKTVSIPQGNVTLAGGAINTPKFDVSAGASGTVNSTLSQNLTKTGAGTLTLGAANTMASTTVSAGTLIAAHGDAFGGGAINVANGALAQAQAGLPKAVTVTTLATNTSGKFDLTDNSMVMKGMTTTQVLGLIQGAFNAGHWNGATGLDSSTAAANATGTTAIGYGTAGFLNKSSFKGVGGLSATDVLVKYTYYGDNDLSGNTTLDDFTLFLGGYQNGGTTWAQGDYDYSGAVTLDDFTLFLKGYQQQGAQLSQLESLINSMPMSDGERAAMLAAVQAVPEPTMIGLLGAAMLGLARRRRVRTR